MDDLSLAKRLLEIGDKNGAIKELSQILKGNPNNIEAWLLCAQATEDINKKKDCYRVVLKLDPNNIEAARGLKNLVSPPLSDTQPDVDSEVSQYNQQKIDLLAIKSKGEDFIRFLLSDKGFKIAVPIMIGIILIIFGISFLYRPKASVPLSPTLTQSGSLRIILKPTDTPRLAINYADFEKVCLVASDLPEGYFLDSQTYKIQDTYYPTSYQKGLENFYNSIFKYGGFSYISCTLLIYEDQNHAHTVFEDLTQLPSGWSAIELKELSNESFGKVKYQDGGVIYDYAFREGRVVADINAVYVTILDIDFITFMNMMGQIVYNKLSLFDLY